MNLFHFIQINRDPLQGGPRAVVGSAVFSSADQGCGGRRKSGSIATPTGDLPETQHHSYYRSLNVPFSPVAAWRGGTA